MSQLTQVQQSMTAAQFQSVVQRGQLAGLTIGQIIQLIFTWGLPVLEQILSLMSSNPTIALIEAILTVLGGLVPQPTPTPTPTPPNPNPPAPIPFPGV